MEREHHHLQFEVQQDRHHHRYRCEDAAPRTPLASLKNTSCVLYLGFLCGQHSVCFRFEYRAAGVPHSWAPTVKFGYIECHIHLGRRWELGETRDPGLAQREKEMEM